MDHQNEQPGAPRRRTTRKKKNNGCLNAFLYIIIIFCLSLILSIVALFAANDVFAFIKESQSITITVPEDTTVKQLGKTLDEEGVIEYSTLFRMFVGLTGKDGDVLAGDYALSPSMDYGAIIRQLKAAAASNVVKVTIPEGYTVSQIRDLLIERGVNEAEELDEALNTYPFKHDFLRALTPGENWLEGYLFPDTYEFYQGDSAVQVINKMLNNFGNRYDQAISEGAQNLERSMHEITTIASMIEREAMVDTEFETISGVIYNRLRSSDFPYLNIDATIQYAVGHKEALSSEDLKIDSPYNTYTRQGLPPGPIASPGYTALYAASHPQSHSYYYYVAMPDGSHLFGTTLSEHNANIQKANEAFSAGAGQ